MTAFAYERVNQALPMPGVIEVSDQYSKGFLIEELFDFIMLSEDGEWEGQVIYLPLR